MSDFVNIEKLSLVDFDGKIACTLFTEVCNFHCPFCHNKDLVYANNTHPLPFDEILSFLNSRKGILEGVCISGGEPTLMNDLEQKIRLIKKLGFLVKLDTNGYRPDVLKRLIDLKLIDYVAMDIKNSLEKYEITTGLINIHIDKIKESIEILKSSNIEYEFRTTLVDEFHQLEDIKKIGSLLKGAKKCFLQKYVSSPNCINKNLHSVSLENAKAFKEELEKAIDNVNLRGY